MGAVGGAETTDGTPPGPFDRRAPDMVECGFDFQEDDDVARSCEVCGKAPVYGRQISHAHNVSSRLWYPNVRDSRSWSGRPTCA